MDTKILLLEDDTMLNEGIAYALRKKGYLVYCAKNIKEASEYLNQPVNLMILDINLPDGDGRAFLKDVRQNNPVPALFLTATEIRLLEAFLTHRNQVLTREQLLDMVWDTYENYVDEKTLNVNVGRLRGKIEEDSREQGYIRTVFGIGYKWSDRT